MNALSGGKLKLIQAALRLITESRSLTSLGLRELAREAGLNPNTFYRHFRNLDEFGLQVLGYIAEEMKAGVRELRQMADSSEQASRDTVAFVYHYFLANPAATTVAVRELHGPSPVLRRALESQLDASAREMAEDIIERQLVRAVPPETIHEISRMTISLHSVQGNGLHRQTRTARKHPDRNRKFHQPSVPRCHPGRAFGIGNSSTTPANTLVRSRFSVKVLI